MTVSSSTDRATFAGNGVATVFPLPFRFFANSDVQVSLIDDATGAVTPQTLGTHYTLTGAALPEQDGNADSELTMLTAPATGVSLFVLRVIPLTQPTDIVNQGQFFPEIHENVFDRLTMLLQQGAGSFDRALRVQDYDPVPARLPGVAQRFNKILSFDVDGNPVAIDAATDSSLVLRQDLANDSDPAKGAELIGYEGITVAEKLGQLSVKQFVSPYDYGAIGDGVADDTAAWNDWIAATGSKVILPGAYLVSAVVKTYETSTFVNLSDNNHAAGYLALESNTTGENNTAYGRESLRKTNGVLPLGSNNVAVGHQALQANVEGYRNVAVGYQALFSQTGNLTTGNSNIAVGYQALFNNTLGKDNTAIGYLSMFFNTEGGGNSALGYRALYNNVGVADTTGQFNTAIGYESLMTNSQGNSNTALGWRAMHLNNTGTRCTATGQEALRNNSIGTNNTATGYHALHTTTSGGDNSALGYQSLIDNLGGSGNSGVGFRALSRNTSGTNNTAIGYQALEFTIAGGSNLSGVNCSGLGKGTRISGDNQVQLGDSATTTYAYGAVQNRSDARDKADVEDTELGIDFIMGLRAVSGRWDMRDDYHVVNADGSVTVLEKDGSKKRNRRHQWFIAQEVEQLCQSLGVDFGGLQHHAKSGGEDVYSIGYEEFIPPVVKAVQSCWARLDEMESRIKALETSRDNGWRK